MQRKKDFKINLKDLKLKIEKEIDKNDNKILVLVEKIF